MPWWILSCGVPECGAHQAVHLTLQWSNFASCVSCWWISINFHNAELYLPFTLLSVYSSDTSFPPGTLPNGLRQLKSFQSALSNPYLLLWKIGSLGSCTCKWAKINYYYCYICTGTFRLELHFHWGMSDILLIKGNNQTREYVYSVDWH